MRDITMIAAHNPLLGLMQVMCPSATPLLYVPVEYWPYYVTEMVNWIIQCHIQPRLGCTAVGGGRGGLWYMLVTLSQWRCVRTLHNEPDPPPPTTT